MNVNTFVIVRVAWAIPMAVVELRDRRGDVKCRI